MPKFVKNTVLKNKTTRELRTDGEATRARILEAAGELFASIGFAEASNKAIAAQAEVDLASINYHFGNRAGLYQAALLEAHRSFIHRSVLEQMMANNLTANERLISLIELFVERALKRPQPWHLQLLAREVLSPSSHIKVLLEEESQPKQLLIKQLLSDITGIPVNDPAITHCLLSVLAPCSILLVGANLKHGPLHDIPQMSIQATVQHLYTFALGGLEAVTKQWHENNN